jgi:hypothetical protein
MGLKAITRFSWLNLIKRGWKLKTRFFRVWQEKVVLGANLAGKVRKVVRKGLHKGSAWGAKDPALTPL